MSAVTINAETSLVDIEVEDIHPAEDNPRQDLGDLSELVESIKGVGILQPLIVVPRPGMPGYLNVAGHRRLAAAKLAGLTTVPCIVRHDLDAQARREAMLVENIQRRDLSVLEEARGYTQLVNDHGYSQRDLAAKLGVNQSHISKRIKLMVLPAELLDKVDAGEVTVETGLQLATLQKDPERFQAVVDGGCREWEVRNQLVAFKHDLKLAKARTEAEKDGLTFVDSPSAWVSLYRIADAGPAYISACVTTGLDIDPDTHHELDCHAVSVDRAGADELVGVCTMPVNHRISAETRDQARDRLAEPELSEEAKARQAKMEILERQSEGRAALERELLDRLDAGELDLEDPQLLAHVLTQLLDAALDMIDPRSLATRIGLETEETYWPRVEVLAYATANTGQLLRTVFAAALEAGSYSGRFLPDFDEDGQPTPHAHHLELLRQHGYAPCQEELDALNPPTDTDDTGDAT